MITTPDNSKDRNPERGRGVTHRLMRSETEKGFKMGARVVFNIKQDEDVFICLYSHWGEESALEDTARAIEKARPRWSDDAYCARIIVSQLIATEWDSETGFGLWVSTEPCIDEAWVLIDLQKQTVSAIDGTHSFEDFVSYHSVAVA
jgi:hypothetical protein